MAKAGWIRVKAYLSSARVAQRLAPLCRGGAQHAAGVLIDFWCSVSDNATDGYIRDESDITLEDWAKWRGKRGAFAAWVREHHMDSTGRVNDWDDYMGELEYVREKARLKKQRQRQGRHGASPPDVPGDGTGDVPGMSPTDGTERNGTERKASASTRENDPTDLATMPSIQRLLERLPEHRRAGYLARFGNWLEGVGLPAGVRVTLPILVDAIDEYDGGDAPDLLLRFVCRKAKTMRDHAAPAAKPRKSMADETYDNALAGALAVQKLAGDRPL